MFFVTRPTSHTQPTPRRPVSTYVDEEDEFVALKRQEYLSALEQHRKRQDIEDAIALENARHRAQLAALAAEEQQRRRLASGQRSSMYGRGPSPLTRPDAIPDFAGPCRSKRASLPPQISQREKEGLQFIFGPHLERKPVPTQKPVEKKVEPQTESIPDDLFENFIRRILQAPESNEGRPSVAPRMQRKSTPVATPAPSASEAPEPKQPEESAAASEGAHWSDAPKRSKALAILSNIARQFETLRRTFVFPENAELKRLATSDEPRLAFTPTNAPIHTYEHALSELLTQLDAVESHGFKGVRDTRKELVVRVEKELDELEKKVAQALAAASSPAKKTTEVPEISAPITSDQAVEEKELHDVIMEVEAAKEVEGYDLESVAVSQDSELNVASVPTVDSEEAHPLEDTSDSVPTSAHNEPIAIEVDAPEKDIPSVTPVVDLSQSMLFHPAPVTTSIEEDAAHVLSNEAVTSIPTTVDPIVIDEPAQLQTSPVSDHESSDTETEDEADAVRVSVNLDGKVQIESNSDVEESSSDREFEML